MAKPVNWNRWLKAADWSIAEAAALLVGVEPHDPGPYWGPWKDDQQRITHDRFTALAIAAVGDKLQSWTRRYPALAPSAADKVSMGFPPGDLMDFAITAKFKVPAPIASKMEDLRRSKLESIQETRRIQFASLVADILLRATAKGVRIEVGGRLQCTRDEFSDLLCLAFSEFPESSSTHREYSKGARLKFRRGRRSSDATNPLPGLFPEYYPTPRRTGTAAGTWRKRPRQ